ncbi:GntR family transcriptional regulator [Kaistia adipata]|uniref:GntR family transcriptional regulator n=1 Tax=Kaistia adipata TaxID=166954 RepID=UPI00041DDAD8|nr:GntR family transcriptional regulator [Kaistia adipata]
MKPQWETLYDELKQGIRSRRFAPGERLPTEHQLSAASGVSRNTVRRAYLALSQDGLIRIVNGRGSYVMQNGIVYEIDAVSRFRDVLQRLGVDSGWRMIEIGTFSADPDMAQKLQIRQGDGVLRYTALVLGNDVPFILATRYFPLDLLADFENRLTLGGSFTALLREEGLGDLRRVSTTVGARMPQDEEAALLECPRNAPLLDVSAVGRLDSGRIVEWQHAVMNSQLIRLSFSA